MNTASLELCKELYELSGWGTELNDWRSNSGTGISGAYPAYDLGYLLQKIVDNIPGNYHIDLLADRTNNPYIARAFYSEPIDGNETMVATEGRCVVAADAACKLAIELFKQGVLK